MSEVKEIFYNLFWQNKACQNLFLLSKEELLDTKTIHYADEAIQISFPRIILSNIESKTEYLHEKIKLRTETHSIRTEATISNTFGKYGPILEALYETKMGKSVELVINDVRKNQFEPFAEIIGSFFDEEEGAVDKAIMTFLHKYNFIGRNIRSFEDLTQYFENDFLQKNLKSILSEENLWTFLELIKSFKDRYVSEVYKGLYNTNQVLVSSFHEVDNFKDRLKLFSNLYESGIISSSTEDSFLECTNCEPSIYRCVIALKTDPIKLKKFKCPICDNSLVFFVPYELNKEIYGIVKAKDGVLLDSLLNKLSTKKIEHSANKHFLNDIEIDCSYKLNGKLFVVECKMYKQLTTEEKLKKKFKQHFSKVVDDIMRIQKHYKKTTRSIVPILLVNINNPKLLSETMEELKKNNSHHLFQNGQIITINDIPFK